MHHGRIRGWDLDDEHGAEDGQSDADESRVRFAPPARSCAAGGADARCDDGGIRPEGAPLLLRS